MDKPSCCQLSPVVVRDGEAAITNDCLGIDLTLPISKAFCSNTRLSINYTIPFRFSG